MYIRVQMYRLQVVILIVLSMAVATVDALHCHKYVCGVKYIEEGCESCGTETVTDIGS